MQKPLVLALAVFTAALGPLSCAFPCAAWARGSSPSIEVSPPGSVVLGDPVRIRLTGLEPHAEYELTADLNGPWGRRWRSSAVFTTGSTRTIDLSTAAPVRGDYSGGDALGLFWSAKPVVEDPPLEARGRPLVSFVTFTLRHEGQVVATRSHERWLVAPGVVVREIREHGLVAELYEPRKPGRHPAVLLLGGSGGGIEWQRTMAGLLASHGYCALALAYFNMETLPPNLDRIPLEYFRGAMDLLRARPGVDPSRIAVIGYSRGAELALLLGTQYEDIAAVVAYAPSFVVFQSFAPPTFPRNSSFTLAGAEIPFVPYRRPRPGATNLEIWMDHLSDTAAVARAAIPAEKIHGPILLFSGKEDGTWPSTWMADRIVERLRARSFRHEFRHVAFDSAGHGLAQAGSLPTAEVVSRNNNGGTARGTAHAQAESWKTLIGFLRRHFPRPSRP